MKRLFLILSLLLMFVSPVFALDTLTTGNAVGNLCVGGICGDYVVTWNATTSGSVDGGTATATLSADLLKKLKGYHLLRVCAKPTSGTPTAAFTLTAKTVGLYDVMQGAWGTSGSATLEVCVDMLWTTSENITFALGATGYSKLITVTALFVK
jgi:hypothetical protein